jgi:triacylglycerol esterase/lipase EstA (alpha/beta hydrolase family)
LRHIAHDAILARAAATSITSQSLEECDMRLATRPLAAFGLTLLGACGSITDPSGPLAKRTPRQPKPIILFVHGWNSSGSVWNTMIGRFKQDGWLASELSTFSYNTTVSNATTANIIAQKVDSIVRKNRVSQVSIVTHSMGALSARYYVRNLGGDGKVPALIALGGTNHGTTTAQLCFQTSCREMWPGSAFLTALNATDETWGTPLYATWWSPCDEVINPDDSALLGGAVNTPTACLQHSQLHEDATVYAQVRDFVSQPAAAAVVATR